MVYCILDKYRTYQPGDSRKDEPMKPKQSKRGLLSILCILAFALFVLYCIFLFLKNDSAPVISINSEPDAAGVSLRISVDLKGEALTNALMSGVTATDREDGDVTDSIIIESLSAFTDIDAQTHVREVVYVAFDSAKNVSKQKRLIAYTDYQKPEITADRDLIFTIGVTEAQILSHLHCIDVIDGDISNDISLRQNSTLQTSTVGVQTLEFEVTNSCGDTVVATFDVELTS